MTPTERLSCMLAATDVDALSERTGIRPRIVRDAKRGKAVSADHHLRLAAAVGFDPFDVNRRIDPFDIGRFDRKTFGECVRRTRRDRAVALKAAAKAAGLSVRAMSWIENGRVVSIDNVLTAASYIGCHPFGFAEQRFTGNARCNPLAEKVAA